MNRFCGFIGSRSIPEELDRYDKYLMDLTDFLIQNVNKRINLRRRAIEIIFNRYATGSQDFDIRLILYLLMK